MCESVLRLFVSVPVAGFRVAYAREYWESYPCPPPSTVYGMLLSLVGETDRLEHRGAELALAVLSHPHRSVVLRTLWRVKDKKTGPGLGANARPDFQELLTDIRLSVWVRKGKEEIGMKRSLKGRLESAFSDPAGVSRFGALALGESTHLVDEIRPWWEGDPRQGRLLVQDREAGTLTLPIWPDHVGAKGTRWDRFRLEPVADLPASPEEAAWVAVTPLEKQ